MQRYKRANIFKLGRNCRYRLLSSNQYLQSLYNNNEFLFSENSTVSRDFC